MSQFDPKETLTLLLSATGERLESASGIFRRQPFYRLYAEVMALAPRLAEMSKAAVQTENLP